MRAAACSSRKHFNPRPSCEGRRWNACCLFQFMHFNPRPSCEGRPSSAITDAAQRHFNPRPSCEGRRYRVYRDHIKLHFNPRPSCEGRLDRLYDMVEYGISIHAPRVRGDEAMKQVLALSKFQSTPLV